MIVPLVDACQMSTTALGTGFPVSAHVTLPCIKATWPSSGVSKLMVLPLGRVGVSARQKGPRIAEAVTGFPLLAATLYVILSTSLSRQEEIGYVRSPFRPMSSSFPEGKQLESSTHDSRPITSHKSWPSFLLSVLIFPAQLIMSTPIIHSSIVNWVSRAKS